MVLDIGFRLRELRRRKKMTQAQVAKRLDLSKTVISGYENQYQDAVGGGADTTLYPL